MCKREREKSYLDRGDKYHIVLMKLQGVFCCVCGS